jgi:Leucine-rich repeat (LRR) protein
MAKQPHQKILRSNQRVRGLVQKMNEIKFVIRKHARLMISILTVVVAAALTACNQSSASAQASGQKISPISLPNKPVIRNGVLRYYGQQPGAVKLKDILSFLALYTDDELSIVTELNLAAHNISNIEGMKRLPSLRVLDLRNNRIEKISGLKSELSLEIINLSQNQIKKVEGLEALAGLKELYLGRNMIEKIENLSSLTNLEVLDLEWNKIPTIEGLGNLKSLRWLLVGGNKLQDYSGLLELDHVEDLSLASPDNVVDEKAKQVFEEWNRRHPDEQIKF